MNVFYGPNHPGGSNTCASCGQVIDWNAQQNRFNAAVKHALGLLPEEGEAVPEPAARQSETGPPAGVDDGEDDGGPTLDRDQQTRVVEAQIVRPAAPVSPRPPRPQLPPPEPEANIRVATNASFFSDWKLP